ncbi:MAG: hypothetical protein AB9834_10580 [Lentimicrobium sp.]
MAETTTTGYRRLLEVRILHHYWLDEGVTLFDSFTEDVRNAKLLKYNIRSFLAVNPTPGTLNLMKTLKAVAKQTGTGLVVGIPEEMPVADNLILSFTIEIKDPAFFSYTAMTLQDRKIFECYSPGDDKIYRYKENVPVFSNLTGAPRGNGPSKQLFLSKEIPAITAGDKVEYLVISGNALLQLTGSQPGAGTQQLNASALAAPVYYHQNDAPLIVPPPGLSGAPARGIELTKEIPDSVFGLISIAAVNPVDPDYSCTTGGLARENPPVFQIRFRNRSLTWSYRNKNNGNPISESATPIPLTFSGNAGTKQKPSSGVIKAIHEGNNPAGRIERIFTDIFE